MSVYPVKLVLIRHGETPWNPVRRIQGGSSDIALSELGEKQVKKLGQALSDMDIYAVYSSPLKRALVTAKAIAEYHDLDVKVEQDLRELEVGELEGVAAETVATNFSHFLINWRREDGSTQLPGGESLLDLQSRAWATVQRILADAQGTVVIVSHYFVILTIICQALGLAPSTIRHFRVGVGSISTLDFKDGVSPYLTLLGDTCHLK